MDLEGRHRESDRGARERQRELGDPLADEGETHPRQVVTRSLEYLRNHQSQMNYADYRRRGLATTSS